MKGKDFKEEPEKFSPFLEGSTIPTFVIDKDHTIIHWNKACARLTGFSSEEMVGSQDQWKAFYLKKRPVMADLVIDRAKAETITSYYADKYNKSSLIEDAIEAEDYFEFGEGEEGKWLFFTAAPLKDSDGTIIGAIETLQDITERKRMEEEIRANHEVLEERVAERTQQLKMTYEQLLHAEKLSAVGKLAASISHEFGNPIIGIKYFLQGLRKSVDLNQTDSEMLELAIKECQRVKNLIVSLQNFNRPTTGVVEPMDLHQAIEDILVFCNKKFEDKKIQVIKKFAASMPRVHAVPDQIKQVILNLVQNAEEAIPGESGTITIITRATEDHAIMRIKDSGKGISPDGVYQIFEPFYSTKEAVEGTGLGLSVSYGIIKRHRGNLEITDTSDKGTTFTMTLPIEAEERRETANRESEVLGI